ncbi:MAG: phytanoyl-CoA dioxygenase family protein [Schleiferiaceae bacterium]|nr:phytanoyl-CoA dioxygenase family protein [Schleiferiaceae bacterium]
MATVAVNIDGVPYAFEVSGAFREGSGKALIHNSNLFPKEIQEQGFMIAPILTAEEFQLFYQSVQQALYKVIKAITPCTAEQVFQEYHHLINTPDKHQKVIQATRNFQNEDFDFDLDVIAERLSKAMKLQLSSHNPALGKSHVQLRISRPNSLDINPPHRDAYLSYYKDVVNLWIPIFGCNSKSSLPVWPSSHNLEEEAIALTDARAAKIDGNTYVVPCVVPKDGGPIALTRPHIPQGSALVFTPFLIHGAAFNSSEVTRFSLELRLSIL